MAVYQCYQRNTYWVCLDFYLEVCIKITAELLPTYLLPWIAFFRHGMKKLHIFLIRKFIAVFIKTHHCSSLKLVLKVHLLLSSYWNLVLPRNVFLSVYLTKVFCAFLLSPKRNTWPHFILVEFIVLVTFGEKNKKYRSSFCTSSLNSCYLLPLISKYPAKHLLLNYARYKWLLWVERQDITL